MTVLGFTGTRGGMTISQRLEFITQWRRVETRFGPITSFHHGDCLGADAEAHDVAKILMCPFIDIHPCNLPAQRAYREGNLVRHPMPPLVRNRHIVDDSDVIIGCPKGMEEELRSGTWATIRYARGKPKKTLVIIYPDGSIGK